MITITKLALTGSGVKTSAPDTAVWSHKVSDFQTGVHISGTEITGTLHYVDNFTEFDAGNPEKQKGNFLCIDFTVAKDATAKFKLVGGDSGEKPLETGTTQCVFRIKGTDQKPHFEVTRGGQTETIEYGLTGLTLETGGDV